MALKHLRQARTGYYPRAAELQKGKKTAVARIRFWRTKQIERLSKLPFFDKILHSIVDAPVAIGSRTHEYGIIMTGAKSIPLQIHGVFSEPKPFKITFILDPLLRLRIMAKPNFGTNPYWIEIKPIKSSTHKRRLHAQLTDWSHPQTAEEMEAIGQTLDAHEKQITFSKKLNTTNIIQLMEHL